MPKTATVDNERQTAILRDRRCNAVRKMVLDGLGTPDDLHRVDVIEVSQGRYRVQVWRTLKDETHMTGFRPKMTDWFWIEAVPDGIVSTPSLERRYHDDVLETILPIY